MIRTRHTLVAFTASLLLGPLAALHTAETAPSSPGAIADGPFKPTFESLKQYRCPEWFRDAKFGIWAHWGPQCVPMKGDWYGYKMYVQGDKDYKDHLERSGHPTRTRLQGHHPALEGREVGPRTV